MTASTFVSASTATPTDDWYAVANQADFQAHVVESGRGASYTDPGRLAVELLERYRSSGVAPSPALLLEAAGRLLEAPGSLRTHVLLSQLGAPLAAHHEAAGRAYRAAVSRLGTRRSSAPLRAFAAELRRAADLDLHQQALQCRVVASAVEQHWHNRPIVPTGGDPTRTEKHRDMRCRSADQKVVNHILGNRDAQVPDLLHGIGLALAHREDVGLRSEGVDRVDELLDQLIERVRQRSPLLAGPLARNIAAAQGEWLHPERAFTKTAARLDGPATVSTVPAAARKARPSRPHCAGTFDQFDVPARRDLGLVVNAARRTA